ncbi:MAG: hypothetical protein QMC37_01300, partial [Flavobacteriales bacterium]
MIELGKFVHEREDPGFYAADYADYLKLNEVQARMLLINLALDGYVDYDVKERWCTWLPKAEKHLKCNRGRVDYDVIAFKSIVRSGANARLGLSSRILEIDGLSKFKLSTEQNVIVTPKYGR